MRRRVSIFGATGSVGQNTVSLLEAQGGAEAYEVVALTGAGNVALLAEQARRLEARVAVTADPDRLAELERGARRQRRRGGGGAGGAARGGGRAGRLGDVGDRRRRRAGARAARCARHGGVLALANKESLVCAGELLRRTCARARHPADPGRQRAQRHLPGAARRGAGEVERHHPDRLGRAVPRLDARRAWRRRRRRRRGRIRTGTWASASRSTAPPCSTRRWR